MMNWTRPHRRPWTWRRSAWGTANLRKALKLSNPTIPDYGIDKAFQETDQRYWLLKCPACGHYTCLEDTFPECLKEVKGRVIRACERCQSELNPSYRGVGSQAARITEKRGYHYSQLFTHYVDPGDILHQFRTTNNLQDFYNLKIGVAYVEAENRLSVEEVLALCGNEGIASSDPGPCSMGVDQGKDLHVVIGQAVMGQGRADRSPGDIPGLGRTGPADESLQRLPVRGGRPARDQERPGLCRETPGARSF